MKKIFLSLFKRGRRVAKYSIFSLLFIFACMLGGLTRVSALNINEYSPNTNKTNGDKTLTPIDGVLVNSCVSNAAGDNFAYSILNSKYAGKESNTGCVAYQDSSGKQYFYIQANDAEGYENFITFTVTVDKLYNYIAIWESNFTLTGENSDYDYHVLGDDHATYSTQRAPITNTKPSSGSVSYVASSGMYIFTFTYELRDASYKEHAINAYFYDAVVELPNPTRSANIVYTLAKPINDYKFSIYQNIPDECDMEGSDVCILYTSNNNQGQVSGSNVTNKFTIKFSNKAALYFSTVNTHGITDITPSEVLKYNTIYATNTFYNEGKEGTEDSIIYHYFNLADLSTYNYAITTMADKYYNFELTIDSSGTYSFYLTDIFGNELNATTHLDDAEMPKIDDISNRELTIYYIAYEGDSDSAINSGEVIDNFQLKEELAALTNENIRVGLEFYFEVLINKDYGVTDETSPDSILMNPLYDEQIRMSANNDGGEVNTTYYCRQESSTSTACVSVGYGSNFISQKLEGAQTIAANDVTGAKAINTAFTYKDGIISNDRIASTRRHNRVDFYVNENGKFFVNLQDIYGNTTSSSIDISLIDQLRPVITVNGNSSLTNYICSSMYVIGGGGTIQVYPTSALTINSALCAGNEVTYNHFEEINTLDTTTSKEDVIRAVIKRNGDQGSSEVDTNGFYNTGTNLVSFDYADAIRIALLEVSDSVTVYNNSATPNNIKKSLYEKDNETYTAYKLKSLDTSSAYTDITSTLTRNNFKNEYIITNNYIQYSSELEAYVSGEYVSFTIYVVDDNGEEEEEPVCNSITNGSDCYNIVNAYIDKAITFNMKFVAKDYVGNESLAITVQVDVIDDTTPGIAKFDKDTQALVSDPVIAGNNLDTTCRLEIGSKIQNKNQLLECYGFLQEGQYNFVDNATTYEFVAIEGYNENNYYKNILYKQLFENYDGNIDVYVCKTIGRESCSDDDWELVSDEPNLIFDNAGSYEIKFVISDTAKDYLNAHTKNTMTIVLCYYVNPRVLLVRPLETSKNYGEVNTPIDYCVYATNNTNAFFYNLFNISSGDYKDTYDYVAKNYESSNFGLIYCTNADFVNDSEATNSTLATILANEEASLTGALSRTYATGNKKYNMELVNNAGSSNYNVYEDAGYYRITMGDLKVDEDHEQNYILRLHPNYLLDETIPNAALSNYYDLTGDQYKYGINVRSHGETISNVLYTIRQARLVLSANEGSKIYGNVDTNYSQAFNGAARTNISALTYKTSSSDSSTLTANISKAGYLNGFRANGIIDNDVVKDYERYESIIEGYLRRRAGEKVGQYYICNTNAEINNTFSNDGCDISEIVINQLLDKVSLTVDNVYILSGENNYVKVSSVEDIVYGRYVKVGENYYKLTRNNTNITELTFDNDMESLLWRYNYDDSDYGVKILVNLNNANQNYYIEYEDALYTIKPQTIIVQPGLNQGKEYSNPTHNDPVYELVVYGETVSITSTVNEDSFNGYTETIAPIGYPHVSDPLTYEHSNYQNTTGGKTPDSELYFSDRRTRSSDLGEVTYTYQFDAIPLVDNKFTLDEVEYIYNNGLICPNYGLPAGVECISSGNYIGVNKVTISGSNVIVTWEGKLTYQDYNLFTSNGTPGTGFITREVGEVVNWYSYIYEKDNLHVISNENQSVCNGDNVVVEGANGECANYNINWVDNAPSREENSDEFITTTTGSLYKHNGQNYCNEDVYSYGCGDNVVNIKFSIYKRDIILSFDASSEVYEHVYSYFRDGVFDIADVKDIPSVITCYKKDAAGKYLAKNNLHYSPIDDDECANPDFGLSIDDTWGESGLNLQFFLNEVISSNFNEDTYPIPAGTYYVYAAIGDLVNGHNNYNLVYIDYYIISEAEENYEQKDGTLEITPKSVNLVGTYYQKEFGQAIYATYGANGEALKNNENYISGVMSASLTNAKQINIFDNNYYYCEGSEGIYNNKAVSYGCDIKHQSSGEENYRFDLTRNVYLYIVNGMVSLEGGNIDEIFANFAGSPYRDRSTNYIAADKYGLLDDAGFYEIHLDNIKAVIAKYIDKNKEEIVFDVDTGTIFRTTNYTIEGITSGGLYITPAQIDISVTDGQTKMYGCAYNTLNTDSTSMSGYTYGSGYSNCVENVEQYYDLGYEYTVQGDKARYLKNDPTRYSEFNSCAAMDSREFGECSDMVYPTSDPNYSYTITPDYNNGNSDKEPNTSLNNGNLYRIPANGETVSYNYAEYFEYARKAQLEPNDANVRFQDQKVGTYAITLGNLDTEFNSNNQCNIYSLPLSEDGVSLCKNFIVNYGGNNTSTHIKSANADKFDTTSATFTLTTSDFDFTITSRKVVIVSEYNYKVYGDTDPNEGYTCQNLKDMFDYTNTTWYGKEYSFDGRNCSSESDFVPTGVARFYAIDNSLAKAPWSEWNDNRENNDNYIKYNDTLYDVIDPSSRIAREGEANSEMPLQNDAVGRYRYIYHLTLNTGLNGNNYTISYLASEQASSSNVDSEDDAYVGFAKTNENELDRWYEDSNHTCLFESEGSTSCDAYTGVQTYNFAINGIRYHSANNYRVGEATTSNLVPDVYFEIVRREIFIQTQEVIKDYGIEDNYLMFDVKLCGEYGDDKECIEVEPANTWGKRNSLSKADYDKFYPLIDGERHFSQAAFKGSGNAASYRGSTIDDFAQAFGIYFYRTYGETRGEYVIVACPTQSEEDLACRSYYQGVASESARLDDVHEFISEVSTNIYNASNYIVKTIPNKLYINRRNVHITPDENQGFMYGNYESGDVIPPITYKEYYVKDGDVGEDSGLVNGSLFNKEEDSITHQIALCIYDISETITCINDRQNSKGATPSDYVTTGLHGTYNSETMDTSNTIGVNVYNDNYTGDNEASRFALNRSLNTDTNARYNRNVGVYTITAGELVNSSEASYCSDTKTTNCLDNNYAIVGFSEGVEYTITPATVVVTPNSSQTKTYGDSDVEITFSVRTYFTYAKENADLYYCNISSHCQDTNFALLDNYDDASNIVTLLGFAYSENTLERAIGSEGQVASENYNYGIARVSNKSNQAQPITSKFGSDGVNNPKYYDKYCYGGNNCNAYDNPHHPYASLTYDTTSRILLGYFYLENWAQDAGAHHIYSGISIALNEFDNANYLYKAAYGDSDEVVMDADTGVTFTINQLAIDATIEDVTKVYGQATDSHKCDALEDDNYTCNQDYATLTADDNEGRLEYNFNVTGDGVNSIGSLTEGYKTVLTREVGGHYYTQTSLPEYKNIHLGLTVVRAINVSQSGVTCINENDKYGCEDAGSYALVFRKQAVANNVDSNYSITYNGQRLTTGEVSGYAIVNETSVNYNEINGKYGIGKTEEEATVSYIKYNEDSILDEIPDEQNSAAENNSIQITIVNGYTATLTINKRNVTFYVGTYNDDGSVAQRYVIEQNEQVPTYPALNGSFTTSSTNPRSKQIYYVTWFDDNEYGVASLDSSKTHAPRQIRTSDVLIGQDEYGVAVCMSASSDVRGEVYGQGACSEIVTFDRVNSIGDDGAYIFDTSRIGDYPIIRNKDDTYITSKANEEKNYITLDYNGVLVIYEDQTAPVIQVGNEEFALEANADKVTSCTKAMNEFDKAFYYDCVVEGLRFSEGNKELGAIIEYLTRYYSGYENALNSYNSPEELPASFVDFGSGWGSDYIYIPVNNIGIKSSNRVTTLYDVYRSENTYAFGIEEGVIDSRLKAVSSIISWFNINSYDYSYVRGDNYISKRYTPRYYIYINENEILDTFDPSYVGDFTITIYAIDNVNNMSQIDVTLKIVDTTKPESGEMHIFNAPVVCNTYLVNSANPAACVSEDIDDFTVMGGRVSIDAFIKYRLEGGEYIEDNVNGNYIHLNGAYVNLFGGVNRYVTSSMSDNVVNILGRYVNVNAGETLAREVEHKYWSNVANKYLVIVGGKDNSYIDARINDELSQWNSYYTLDGTTFYKYERHSSQGARISFADGINTIYTRVLDSGRKFSMSEVSDGYVYYNDVYLRYVESGETCDGLANCEIVSDEDMPIVQVKDEPISSNDNGATYTFKIQSVVVTYNVNEATASWQGQQSPANVSSEEGVYKFDFGIMVCSIDIGTLTVSCQTDYKLVYNSTTSDRVSVSEIEYTVTNQANIGDWDALEEASGFYKDRRYVLIDTGVPTIELNGYGYGVYEYDTKCAPGVSDDNICKQSYDEKFLNANDGLNAANNQSVVASDTQVSISDLTMNGYSEDDIIYYVGDIANDIYVKGKPTNEMAGLLTNDSTIVGGNSNLETNDEASEFNKTYLDLAVYLNVKLANDDSVWYRYLAIYDGAKYLIFRQKYANGGVAVINSFEDSSLMEETYTTIEEVLEFIVSTASVVDEGANYTFSINYVIRDAANNASVPIDNKTVRGVTYTRLSSDISVSTVNQILNSRGNNSYYLNVNQGMSLTTLLDGFTINNMTNDGINNMTNVKQTLYYEGKVIFSRPYNSEVLKSVEDNINKNGSYIPGTYVLKFTSERQVESKGRLYTIEDRPLEIEFNIAPVVASATSSNYQGVIIGCISLALVSLMIITLGYISLKRRKD